MKESSSNPRVGCVVLKVKSVDVKERPRERERNRLSLVAWSPNSESATDGGQRG